LAKTVQPDESLEMLKMYEENDMSYEEIAEEMGYTRGTVRRHVKRAQEITNLKEREYERKIEKLQERIKDVEEKNEQLREKVDEYEEEEEEKERIPFRGELSRTEDGEIVLKTKEISGENYRRLLTGALQNDYADINKFIEEVVVPHMRVVSDFKNRFGRYLGPGLLRSLINYAIQNPPSKSKMKRMAPQAGGEQS